MKCDGPKPPPGFRLFNNIESAHYFFVVANSLSGGNDAASLLHLGFNYVEFVHHPNTEERPRDDSLSSLVLHRLKLQWKSDGTLSFLPSPKPDRPRTASAVLQSSREEETEEEEPGNLMKIFIADISAGESGQKNVFNLMKAVANSKLALLRQKQRQCECGRGGSQEMPPVTGSDLVRVMVAGGDGTMMWCFSELEKHGIDESSVAVGSLPYGTGNDFARAMGSRCDTSVQGESPIQLITRLASHWMSYRVENFDLWKVSIDARPDGCFKKIDGKTRTKKALMDDQGGLLRHMDNTMANYFSIGIESRIGIGFDRNRTKSAVLNKAVRNTRTALPRSTRLLPKHVFPSQAYALEGLKKGLFHRTRFLNTLIDRCTVQNPAGSE